ncbi:hypothetical protein [Actinomadura sp. WAC 06369]|uniref:hypothetical protein n=1 Tax=Actinomadura sp. WAC 06369 TaxID=2203193 RepID=UPI000F78239F|nr:hypothetical protein [Actinomadura sp. WAC 06369]RSN68121.1 hypothetical protein DMH08_11975 [Actinomadura sp. WAC 06369]
MSEEERLSPTGLPWPPEWSMRPGHGRARLAGFAGAGGVLVAFGYAMGMDDDPFGGAAIALTGAGLLLVPAVLGVGRRRGPVSLATRRAGGERHRGVVFPVRWSYRIALPLMLAAFGAGSAALSGTADPAVAGDPILLLIGAVLLAWSPRCLVGVLGFRGVLLTPEAVVVRSGMHRTALRLPWREIDGVVPYERSGEGGKEHKLIALTVLDASHLRVRWWPRVKYRYFGVRDAETTVHAGRFGADPALLLLALRHYLDHPADRPELGGREAVERIRAGRLLG